MTSDGEAAEALAAVASSSSWMKPPNGIELIGTFGCEKDGARVHCQLNANGIVGWNVPITIVKNEKTLSDHVILYMRLNSMEKIEKIRFCMVKDQVISVSDQRPCGSLLPAQSSNKKGPSPISYLPFSHAFASDLAEKVLPIEFLVNGSPSGPVFAPRLTFVPSSLAPPFTLIDVVVFTRRDSSLSMSIQQLYDYCCELLSNQSSMISAYYAIPHLSLPVQFRGAQSDVMSCPSGAYIRLHRFQCVQFITSYQQGGRLYNVHRALKKSDLTDGITHCVQGSYAYYHYMQDGFNDDGWGCAYRSLQTLWSWALLQQHTNDPVPSHERIQEILFALDEKPASFIGSKQWIGAVELNMILTELGIPSRILYLPSGSNFGNHGRELAQHFDTHGSPVMIGGGVLAYTLLGVDVDQYTGEVRYLILDPHYKGAEDIDMIIAKGWCSWHKGDLFDANSFYNLCLPLNPLAPTTKSRSE